MATGNCSSEIIAISLDRRWGLSLLQGDGVGGCLGLADTRENLVGGLIITNRLPNVVGGYVGGPNEALVLRPSFFSLFH
jgi:hypothetical protein